MNPTNQASPEFSVVPVFPAANSPKAARRPVPWLTTVAMICVAVAASAARSAGMRSGSFSSTTLSLSSMRTAWMPTGPSCAAPSVPVTRRPPAAKVSKACAMSSGVTPSRRPPSVIAGLAETGVRMPMRVAVAATLRVPTWMPAAA